MYRSTDRQRIPSLNRFFGSNRYGVVDAYPTVVRRRPLQPGAIEPT